MAEIGRNTLNQTDLLEVNADPSVQGVAAPVGSVAMLYDEANPTAYGQWQKVGLADTDWKKLNPGKKSGYVNPGDFSGTPKKATVTFATPFLTTNYVVQINGTNDNRSWTYESVNAGSFVINANANSAITGIVSWAAELVEETS